MKTDIGTPGRLHALTCGLAISLGWATCGVQLTCPAHPALYPHLSAALAEEVGRASLRPWAGDPEA